MGAGNKVKGRGWDILAAVVFSLLGAGILFFVTRPPRGDPIQLLPPPTPAPILVHVSGAVNQPGVYALPDGSRARDAIDAAQGFSPQANEQAVNLAALLQDGGQLSVPTRPVAGEAPTQASGGVQTTVQFPVDINAASQQELEALPEIGPVTAQKIIAYRQEHGPFATIEEIEQVDGIGPKTFQTIKELITVGGAP